jgi:hypothetical protein
VRARADAMLDRVEPILRQLRNADPTVFGIVARVELAEKLAEAPLCVSLRSANDLAPATSFSIWAGW